MKKADLYHLTLPFKCHFTRKDKKDTQIENVLLLENKIGK